MKNISWKVLFFRNCDLNACLEGSNSLWIDQIRVEVSNKVALKISVLTSISVLGCSGDLRSVLVDVLECSVLEPSFQPPRDLSG